MIGLFASLSMGCFGQTWTNIATDVSGDGSSAGLLDGTALDYYYDSTADSLWFRMTTNNMNATNSAALGFNVMVNYTGGGSTFNFWGNANTAAYHNMITGWVTGSAPSNYNGTIGIANAAGVGSNNYTNQFSNNLDISVDVANNTIVVGMQRDHLVPNSALGQPVATAAAVGSNQFWNDDIYSPSGTMTVGTSGGGGGSGGGVSVPSSWTNITNDPSGDGSSAGLLDGTAFDYNYDSAADSLWFRLTCSNMNASNSAALGFNIMVNYPGGSGTFNFWGNDNTDAFHNLVTGWVTGSAPSNYTGTIGIANSSGVSSNNYTNQFSNNLTIVVNVTNQTIIVGMPRADLLPNGALGQSLNAAAAVGSNQFWNDDIYASNATITVGTSSGGGGGGGTGGGGTGGGGTGGGSAMTWTNITNDPSSDGASAGLLDGTAFDYNYDSAADSLWFRITCANLTTSNSAAMGFNIMVNYPNGGSTFNFWGNDNTDAYHNLVTGWVSGSAPSSYTGTIGISDAAGVGNSDFTSQFSNNLDIRVSVSNQTIIVGMPREDLLPDDALGEPILAAAAVGSNTSWNDDIYASNATMTVGSESGEAPVGLEEIPQIEPSAFFFDGHLNLNLHNAATGLSDIRIISMNGQVVAREQVVIGSAHWQTSIPLHGLTSGIYILQLQTQQAALKPIQFLVSR